MIETTIAMTFFQCFFRYEKRHLRIVVVGAGATGLQIAYKAERVLENVDLQIYEKNSDIGGTWLGG